VAAHLAPPAYFVATPVSGVAAVAAPDVRKVVLGEVKALQLGQRGRKLTVLLAGPSGDSLEAWSLTSGRLLGRWTLPVGYRYSAMCHDGRNVLLARPPAGDSDGGGSDGLGGGASPLLERAPLPAAASENEEEAGKPQHLDIVVRMPGFLEA